MPKTSLTDGGFAPLDATIEDTRREIEWGKEDGTRIVQEFLS